MPRHGMECKKHLKNWYTRSYRHQSCTRQTNHPKQWSLVTAWTQAVIKTGVLAHSHNNRICCHFVTWNVCVCILHCQWVFVHENNNVPQHSKWSKLPLCSKLSNSLFVSFKFLPQLSNMQSLPVTLLKSVEICQLLFLLLITIKKINQNNVLT